jgi:hypothetical protein
MMLKMMNPFGSVTDALPSVGGGDSEDRSGSSESFTNLEFRIYNIFYRIFVKIPFSTGKLKKKKLYFNLFVTSKQRNHEFTNSQI